LKNCLKIKRARFVFKVLFEDTRRVCSKNCTKNVCVFCSAFQGYNFDLSLKNCLKIKRARFVFKVLFEDTRRVSPKN
jgi:hypothetical protein